MSTFLAIRIDPVRRRRLKAIAALRGQSLQSLVGALVDDLLADAGGLAERAAATRLNEIRRRLRARRRLLRRRGIRHLHVYGSVARGEAGPDSDVDIAATFAPGRKPSLVGFAGLRAEIADIVEATVDLTDRDTLTPKVATNFAQDAVEVF